MNTSLSKLEELYIHFTKNEKEDIAAILQCRVYNQSEHLIRLHQYLSEKVSIHNEVDKFEAYTYVFEGETFNDNKYRVYQSRLIKIIEKYIIIEGIDDFPIAEVNLLYKYYNDRKMHKSMTTLLKSKNNFESKSFEDKMMYDFYFSNVKLSYINTYFPTDNELIYKTFKENLKNQTALHSFQILTSKITELSFSAKYKTEELFDFNENAIEKIIENKAQFDDMVQQYASIYLLIKNQNETDFFLLKENLHQDVFEKFEHNLVNLIVYLKNFCIRQINLGNPEYLTHLFELNEFSLKFYQKEGDLTSLNFRNIVYCALQLEKLEWTEKFIEEYNHTVAENDQKNSYNFNYARLYFEKKDYDVAMRQLLKVTYEDSFYASTARILLIKCNYELNDEYSLIYNCQSLFQFLNRNKLFTKERVTSNLKFINYVKRIQNKRLNSSNSYYKNLRKTIEESTVIEKKWLLEKIDIILK
jgi:hypothetical protein